MACLDERAGLYRALRGVEDVREYLATKDDRADEETLTELVLRELLQKVLRFPADAVFEQLSRDGSKPDFTPIARRPCESPQYVFGMPSTCWPTKPRISSCASGASRNSRTSRHRRSTWYSCE